MRRALIAAMIATALWAPPAAAADPVPPETSMNDHGPNVPVWQTWEIFGSAGSSPIDHFECRLDSAAWAPCTSPWHPDLTGGDHAIETRSVDSNGLADPTPATAAFFVDVEGPIVSVHLNEDAPTTGRHVVALDLEIDDRASIGEILISNSPELDEDGLLANALDAWVVGPPTWRLDLFGGDAGPGVHTVYVQARDAFGQWGEPGSDSIIVDPSKPSTVTIRLAVSQDPAPIGGRILLFGVAHADDGAQILDGELRLGIRNLGYNGGQIGWPVELGDYIDASGLAAGTYTFEGTYTGSADLENATASLGFSVGPNRSLIGPLARFVDGPTPVQDPSAPTPFHLGVGSKWNSAATFQCRVDGSAWAACNSGLNVPVLADGWHMAEVRGIDDIGRVQSIPEQFIWFIRPTGGTLAVSPNGGFTADPNVFVSFSPPPGALALRVSNDRAVDGTGALMHAREWTPPVSIGVPTAWDLTDPDYGGTSADGRKVIAYQWQLADASWSTAAIETVRLDRVAPQLQIRLENGSAFSDEDELLVVATTSEVAAVAVSDDPAQVAGGGGVTYVEGMELLSWPVGDVPLGTIATRHLYARARDQAGNLSEVVDATVTIDRSSPAAGVPGLTFDVGSRVSRDEVDAWVTTSASDTGSGVAKVALQRRSGTSWTTVSSANKSSLKVLRTVALGSSSAFRSRGIDRLGHIGAWATTASLLPVLRGDGHRSIVYSGQWSTVANASMLGNSFHRTRAAGAKATIQVTARALGIIAPRGPQLGRFEVRVDGVKVGVVDLRRDSSRSRVLVFAKSWSTASTHTVVIRNLDAGGRAVGLDGFVILP